MRTTQYIEQGVLVRPLEPAATNFLSSRFYDGRGIIDLLDTPESTHAWMTTLRREIQLPHTPFTPDDTQLAKLRTLRSIVETLYRATVAGDAAATADHLSGVLGYADIQIGMTPADSGIAATWSTTPEDPFAELVAQIAVTAAMSVTGRAATLLRKCEAPRCVLYYTQHNSRQHWCSDVCGNRVRVSRSTKSR